MDELLIKFELPLGVLDEGVRDGVKGFLEVNEHGKAGDVILDGIVHDVVYSTRAFPNVSAWKVCFLVVANDLLEYGLHSVGEDATDDLVVAVQEGDWSQIADDPLILVLLGDQNDDTFSLLVREGACF